MLPRWRRRNTVLAFCILAYFGIRFSEFVISPVLPQIVDGLGISTSLIGVAFTASTVAYALAQLPSGVLGDRFGERTVILAALGLTGIGSVLLAVSPSGLLLIVAMTLLGMVSGSYYSPATALLSDLFEDTGRAIGIHRIGGQAVGFTAPLVALVGVAFGWRVALLLGALVAFPVLIGFRIAVQPSESATPDTSVRERVKPGMLKELLSRPSIAYTTFLAGLGQFADTATFSFLIAILQEYHGFSPELASVIFTVYFAALTAVQPLAGWLSDRFGPEPTTVMAMGCGIFGYVLLLFGGGVITIAVAVSLVGLGMGWSPPIQSRFMDELTTTERGTGFGLVRTVYIGFAALNGIIIGTAAAVAGWSAAIVILAVVLTIAVLVIGTNRLFGFEL